MHQVCDIYCTVCNNKKAIGWKYVKNKIFQVKATEADQKYKEDKYILE